MAHWRQFVYQRLRSISGAVELLISNRQALACLRNLSYQLMVVCMRMVSSAASTNSLQRDQGIQAMGHLNSQTSKLPNLQTPRLGTKCQVGAIFKLKLVPLSQTLAYFGKPQYPSHHLTVSYAMNPPSFGLVFWYTYLHILH